MIYRRSVKVGTLTEQEIESPVISLRSSEAAMRFFLRKTDSEDLKKQQLQRLSQ